MNGDATSPVAVVTGGGSGLGLALVQGLLGTGAQVAVGSRHQSAELGEVIEQHPGRCSWHALDLSDPAAIRPFVREITMQFGRIDVLVNNAGVLHQELFLTTNQDHLTDLISINLTGPLLLTQAVIRQMDRRGTGSVLNISSINATHGHRGVAVYSAAKAGMDGLTRALARECGGSGIRVNSLVPGYFDTDMTAQVTDRNRARIIRRTPLGRLGTVADVAHAALFLVSPEASFITGQTLTIDGGLTC